MATGLTYAMDLTPLVKHPTRDILAYLQGFLDAFATDVAQRITKLR